MLQVCAVLEFLLFGELENLTADGELMINLVLSKTKVDNVEEAFAVARISPGFDIV